MKTDDYADYISHPMGWEERFSPNDVKRKLPVHVKVKILKADH